MMDSSPGLIGSNRKTPLNMSAGITEELSKAPSTRGLPRRNSLRVINTQNYTEALDAVKDGQHADEDTFEDIRVNLKKYLSTSTVGKYYDNFILFMSVFSMFEFIYATYLDTKVAADRDEKYYLDLITLGFVGLFALDWMLSLFLADHKLTYFTR
jgi:outer membrane phospholipase A